MDFDLQIIAQRERLFHLLETEMTGNDELSALIDCALNGLLFVRIDTINLMKWVVYLNGKTTGNKYLNPYSISMDMMVPGENIVMFAQQRARPGLELERWSALQKGANTAYLANDRILACRLNALRWYFSKS